MQHNTDAAAVPVEDPRAGLIVKALHSVVLLFFFLSDKSFGRAGGRAVFGKWL